NILYSIKEAGNVRLEIYNLRGQLVKTLVNEVQETGEYTTSWNGTDNSNKPVSSGVYLYKMKSANYTATKKMILMK
ncbi:MAG: T9SS type A sorting domain-containing protein, partial [Candidatus Delongbacteria bacterium]|nr:T9SS type A sorting domain-containing protein [Candidatus Delongbacteria bacterium]